MVLMAVGMKENIEGFSFFYVCVGHGYGIGGS